LKATICEATRGVETTILRNQRRMVEEMIRKLKSGEYRLYSRKKNAKTGKRRNLGTFSSLEKAKAHERAVQYFKRH
jgi:23S rRNA maturation mini-RNase III